MIQVQGGGGDPERHDELLHVQAQLGQPPSGPGQEAQGRRGQSGRKFIVNIRRSYHRKIDEICSTGT